MNIEQLIQALITSLDANTAAHTGGTVKASAVKTEGAGDKAETKAAAGKTVAKSKAAAAAPKYTVEQVKAAAVRLKDEESSEAAKAMIKKHGAAQLADLKPAAYDAFVEEITALLDGDDAGEDDAGEDDGL